MWEGKYMTLAKAVSMKYNKTIEKCSNEEIYYALLDMTKQMAEDKVSNEGKKKLYYISAEFLIGKLLSNNLINLGIYDSVKSELEASGKNIGEIEEIELEPSLGNGGLGRLAACFVDSIATLGLNGDGVGLNYHYGLFKQVFDHNLQKETPNPWITPDSWLTKTDITYPVQFGGFTVQSRLYNIDVVGYNNRTTKLRLFDIETVDESIVGKNSIYGFDRSKLIFSVKKCGIAGNELQKMLLRTYNIEMEMAAGNYALALTSLCDTDQGFHRLFYAVKGIDEQISRFQTTESKKEGNWIEDGVTRNTIICTMNKAFESQKESVALQESEGRVSGEFLYLYPPGIPMIVPGEKIDGTLLKKLERYKKKGFQFQGLKDYGGEKIEVVK